MKLSVITICYNDLENLKKTVHTVNFQENLNFEHIIQDGSSNDGTAAFLEQAQLFSGTKLFCEKDSGIYDAMNRAVKNATGEYVYFLNSGDQFYDSYVTSALLKTIKESPDLIYGKVLCITEEAQWLRGGMVQTQDFRFGMPLSHQGVVYRRKDLLEHPYNLQYRIIADYIVTRDLFHHASARYIEHPICAFDLQGVSSVQFFKTWKERFRLALEEKDFPAVLHAFLVSLPRSWIVKVLIGFGIRKGTSAKMAVRRTWNFR